MLPPAPSSAIRYLITVVSGPASLLCVWPSRVSKSFRKTLNSLLTDTVLILLPQWNSQRNSAKTLLLPVTQVIGLTNDDAVSTEHRPFKQMIERLNRTYKASYRIQTALTTSTAPTMTWLSGSLTITSCVHINTISYKVLNEVEMLQGADNMPGKWQLLIFLGQQTILNIQKNGTAASERNCCQ